MKFLTILAISTGLLTASQAMEKPSFHTKGTPIGKATGPLKPGEYWWKPQLSPSGPVVALVSIPQQTFYVYRNGILIGRSSLSSGKNGSTPGGVFTILEKKATHHSKKYDNAPMPNMQRLTWSGIAMHSGQLPGYPASHGCIRLPYDFLQLLFATTAKGAAVEISARGIAGRERLGSHVFTLLEGSSGRPSQLAPGREAGRWMRVSSEGRAVDAEELASRIRFNTDFAQKLADEIKPGTTVIVTDQPAVRNSIPDSTYFAAK